MIAKILEQQQAICTVSAEDQKNWHRMPTDNKLSTLDAVASVPSAILLIPFQVKNVSSSRQSVSFSVTSWMTVFVASPDDCAIVKEMKEIIGGDKVQASYLHV